MAIYSAEGGVSSFAAAPTKTIKGQANTLSEPRQAEQVQATEIDEVEEPAPEKSSSSSHFIVRVGRFGEALHQVKVTQGTTVGQLTLAEGCMINPNATWRPTDAMGQGVPISSELQKDQIIFISDITKPKPVSTFTESQYASGCKDVADRITILWNQQGWVATDEMAFYLTKLHEWGPPTSPPLQATSMEDLNSCLGEWIMSVLEEACQAQKKKSRRTAVLVNQHWAPVMVEAGPNEIHIHTTKYGETMFQSLPDLMSFEDLSWHTDTVKSHFPYDCGFQAFAWLQGYATGGIAMPMSIIQAIAMREEFELHCLAKPSAQPFELGGVLDEKLFKQLQALLETHGVATTRSHAAASNLVSVLGNQSVTNALNAPRPWKDLKMKASMQKPPLQIVLTEELQAAVTSRAQNGQAIGKRNNKKMSNKQKPPLVLPADKIMIPNAIFQQDDGMKINQLTIHQIHGNAKGVVVVNVNDALPFFQLNDPVSTEGIALLILDHHDMRIPEAKQIVKFPAHFSDTEEPILVTAAMLQIGAKQVQRHKPDTCVTIDEVPTQVVRILAYHDQIKIDWATLIEGPIKALLAQDVMSFLSHDKILDIWDRQFLDSNFRKTVAKDAYVFAATIRLHQDAASELLSLSGKDGMYSEPRTDNGRAPDPAFRVIWLPRKTFAEAALINQTTQQQSWLVRNGERLGIRVAEADASEVHTLHRPDVNYLDGTSVKSYKVGPMPWGTTKSSLQKVFNQWQWNARPGQPQGQAADGVFWTAQATQHPSHWVFTMAHGDVLISHNDAIKAAKTSIASSVIASTKTLKQLTVGPKKQTEGNTVDPWLIHDPWASYAKAPTPSLSNAQLAQMQTSIEQNIREAMTLPEDATMDAVADARVTALEDQVKQLTANVGQLTGTVNTINHQQHQLGTQVQKMKSHIDTQNASLHSMIDAKLEDQMSRIEALMSKRSKTSE